MLCGSELGRGRPVRRLRSATLARGVVGVCDSNSGDHDGESGRTGPIRGLPGMSSDYRGLPLFQPARPRSTIASNTPESSKSSSHRYCGRWRDPDSNRGHHDFQSWAEIPLTGAKVLQSGGFASSTVGRAMLASCVRLPRVWAPRCVSVPNRCRPRTADRRSSEAQVSALDLRHQEWYLGDVRRAA